MRHRILGGPGALGGMVWPGRRADHIRDESLPCLRCAGCGPQWIRNGARCVTAWPAHPQEATAGRGLLADGSVGGVRLAGVAAASILEAITHHAPGSPDAAGRALERDPWVAESDQVVLPSLIPAGAGVARPPCWHGPAEAALISEVADLLGEVRRPPPGEPIWPDQPLTHSDNRVLRYLPTHLSAREIAEELCLSANTVRTYLRHLYQKLGGHSRHDVVQRAHAIGLLAASSRTP